MKLKHTLLPAVLLFIGMGYLALRMTQDDDGQATLTLFPEKGQQQIDGFGVAQAGWADELFLFSGREKAVEALFGENGLRLNILRGEIFPHYSPQPFDCDFGTKADKQMKSADEKQRFDKHELLELGQYWLTDYVQRNYPDTRCIFSAWSPPAWMKESGALTPDGYATGGALLPAHYQDYADYLADFCQAYAEAGISVYALSPSNEPGYAAPWNSCVWNAHQMGRFISGYLLPTLERKHIPAKVIFGENPAWSTVFSRLKMISSADFVNEVLSSYPEMETGRLIAAGHGYVLPDTIPLPAEQRRTPIIPFVEAEKRNIPVWVTEISDITPLDLSMSDGLRWASTFSDYLTNAHVSAIVWWAGAQPTTTNESLIVMDKESGGITLSKRYDTFGHYTRYIPRGSRAVEHLLKGLPEEVRVSSFCHEDGFTVVMVNPTDLSLTCRLDCEGGKPMKGSLRSYTTTASQRWAEDRVQPRKSGYVLQLLPQSVTTYTGRF